MMQSDSQLNYHNRTDSHTARENGVAVNYNLYTIDEAPITDGWGNTSLTPTTTEEGAANYRDDATVAMSNRTSSGTPLDPPSSAAAAAAAASVVHQNPGTLGRVSKDAGHKGDDDDDDHDEHMDLYEDEPQGPEAFEDPYSDTPYPVNNDPYEHTPYATDRDGVYGHDPFGELDYSNNGAADDLEDIEMSKRGHGGENNIQGGEYEFESKDPKIAGSLGEFLQHYGKSIFVCFIFMLASVIVIGIILLFTMNNSSSTYQQSKSPWGVREDATFDGHFVPPPLELQTVCTVENIDTKQGFLQCQQLCAPAQCCRFDPKTAPTMSCQTGHLEDCHTYHHYCERPPKATMLPLYPPPDNLKDICTAEKVQTAEGVTACARVCEGGVCCRYPTTLPGLSCLRGNEAPCQIYHQYCDTPPSENQSDESSSAGSGGFQKFPFVRPPDDIKDRCSGDRVATAEGFEECLEICRSGTCCRFDPDDEPHLSCRNEQPADCPIYDQYCGGNTNVISDEKPHADGGTGVSGNNLTSLTYVESACSDHSLATIDGFTDCQQACAEAECCWKTDSGISCPTGTHCEPYSHCLAMEASDHIDVAVQVAVNLKCTDTQLATQEGRKACLLACSQATCCFGNSGQECPHENDSFCNQYESCKKAFEDSIPPIPPAPQQLNQICSRDNLADLEGLAECDKVCAHASCCWQKTGTTTESCATSYPFCSDYASCSILEQGAAAAPTHQPVPAAPATIADVCTPEVLTSSEGGASALEACEDACEAGECCWKTGDCLYQQPEICTGFAPCAILLEEVPAAPSTLANFCTADKVSTDSGAAICEGLCDPAACCWKTGACLTAQSAKCQGYQSCSVLMSLADPPIKSAPDALPDYCTEEAIAGQIASTGISLCQDVCRQAECCWKTESCLVAQAQQCRGYISCGILLENMSPSPTHAPFPAAQSFLPDVCTPSKVANVEGAILCEDACKVAECCWRTKTCLEDQAELCEGYASCSVLAATADQGTQAGDGSPSPAPANVVPEAPTYLNTVCDSEIGGDQVHGHLCLNACERASCCWKGNSTCSTNPNCAGYSICEIVNFDALVATASPVATNSAVPGTTPAPTPTTATTTAAPGPTPAPGTTAAPADEYTAEMITDACLNHDNSIVNLCAKICEGSECCFHEDNANGTNCGDFPCYKYSACAVIHPENDDLVQEQCTNGELSDCIQVCGGSTCCFTQNVNHICAVTNPGIVCSRFEACERIYNIGGG